MLYGASTVAYGWWTRSCDNNKNVFLVTTEDYCENRRVVMLPNSTQSFEESLEKQWKNGKSDSVTTKITAEVIKLGIWLAKLKDVNLKKMKCKCKKTDWLKSFFRRISTVISVFIYCTKHWKYGQSNAVMRKFCSITTLLSNSVRRMVILRKTMQRYAETF